MKPIPLGTTSAGKPFTVPVDLVTQTVAVVGMRGAGKTNTGVVGAEGLLAAGQQVVIIDPLDVWWGLRSSADGKADGFPVVVIGGEHADLPLEAGAGKAVADFVTDHRASVVISTRHLSKTKQRSLVADFAEHLYDRKGKTEFKTPLQLFIDEADAFAPQRIEGDTARCFGAIDDLVRRGRSSGFGVTVITQRPAVLHKDILTQVEMLVVHRIVSPQDRKAIEAWVEVHDAEGVAEKVLGSLHQLGKGETWVWSPAWLGLLERVQIAKRGTFDSSYTPKVGESRAGPKKVAAVDLEQLKKAMGETLEKAKANDPATLKRRIAELEKAAKAVPARVEAKVVEVSALQKEDREMLAKVASDLNLVGTLATGIAEKIDFVLKKLANLKPGALHPRPLPPASRPSSAPKPRASSPTGDTTIGEGERKILVAIAQYPDGVERDQLSVLTGYKRSTRDAYVQRLGTKGMVQTAGQTLTATAEGFEALGDFEPLPTGSALGDYWMADGRDAKLPEGERAILKVMIEAEGNPVSRDELTERTGYKRSTRDAYIQRLTARRLVESVGRGDVQATRNLFEG